MPKDSKELQSIHTYPDGRMDTQSTSIYTGYAIKTLAMMRCKGTGPKYVKHGKIFYYAGDVNDWLLTAKFISTAQSGLKAKTPLKSYANLTPNTNMETQ